MFNLFNVLSEIFISGVYIGNMAFIMDMILSNAQMLSNHLKKRDGSTDNLLEQMTILNKKIESMKTFQDNLPDLNEMALRKPRCTIKLGVSQENGQIRVLEQENRELRQLLEEHELALELIMSKYRHQVSKLLQSNQANKSIEYKEMVRSKELQDKAEKIYEMGKVMWEAVGDEGRSTYDSQQLLTQLRLENKGIRELISIACNSGNPLKAVNQHTQTVGATCSSHLGIRSSGFCLSSESSKGDSTYKRSEISGDALSRNSMFNSLNSEMFGHCNDYSLASADASREFPPINRLSFSEKRQAHSPQLMPIYGQERVQSLSSDVVLPDVVTTKSCSKERKIDEELQTLNPRTMTSPIENHVVENRILDYSVNFRHSKICADPASVSTDTIATTCNSNQDHALQISSSSVNTATVAVASMSSPDQCIAGDMQVNVAQIHKNKNLAAAASSGECASSKKNPSSPGHGVEKRNVITSSVESPTSRPKHGNTAVSSLHTKTPVGGKIPSINDASTVTGGKLSPSTSPSVRSGKTTTTGQPDRSIPVGIKATAKHPSVFSVVGMASSATPQSDTTSSLTDGAASTVMLDNNGNSHSSVPNEISNTNKTSSDKALDGQ